MKAQVLFDSCNFCLTSDGETRDRTVLKQYISNLQFSIENRFNGLSDDYIKSTTKTFINHALVSLINLNWCNDAQKLPASKTVHVVNLNCDLLEKWTIILHQVSKTDKYVLIYIEANHSTNTVGNLYMCFDGDQSVLDDILSTLNLKNNILYAH